MPIRRELRHFYGAAWRKVTRPRILERAGNKCEQCGCPNHTDLGRIGGFWLNVNVSWKHGVRELWIQPDGSHYELSDLMDPPGTLRKVRIVLTIAHLNHEAGDDRDENLKALCQWCHLNYDKLHHRETRSTRKDAARPLLQELSA
jgi:hypothetical protein